MELNIPLMRVGMMNLILILSHPLNIQGREPYLYDIIKNKTLMLACVQTFTDWFLFRFGMVIETTKLYIFISVWMTLTSFNVTVVSEIKTSVSSYSQI